MIRLKKVGDSIDGKGRKHGFSIFGSPCRIYFVYDVDEITKIELATESPYADACAIYYFDSKERMFAAASKHWVGRVKGYVPVTYLQDRLDIVPKKLHEEFLDKRNGNHTFEFRCIDPRVIWCDIVYTWIFTNGICGDLDELGRILSDNLPSFQAALQWLEKNKFRVFNPEPDHGGDSVSAELRDYYQQDDKLYYPPEIDWERYNVSVPEGRGIMGKD